MFIVVVLGSMFIGVWPFFLLFGILSLIGLHEYYRLADAAVANARRIHWPEMMAGGIVYVSAGLAAMDLFPLSGLWVLMLMAFSFLAVDMLIRSADPFRSGAITLLGWLYVPLPFAFLTALSHLTGQYEPWLPAGFFFVLWTNDTGAYLAGMAFGKHKLFPSVSPNKTWEGLFGGIVLSVLIALLVSSQVGVLETREWIGMALSIGVFGNMGDLYESWLKRVAGVKDSGRIMPGHGGVLDRFDGLLFALPVFLTIYFLIHL